LYTQGSNGCKSTNTFTISEPQALVSAVSTSVSATCASCNDGSVTVSPIGGTGPYSFSWTPNVSTTSSAGSLSNGCYTIDVTDSQSCQSQTVVCLFIPTSIGERSLQDLKIYPNPASSRLYIDSNEDLRVTIYSVSGQKLNDTVQCQGNCALDVSGLAKGLYLLQVQKNEQIRIVKLVLE
jgi:hypothetical protein